MRFESSLRMPAVSSCCSRAATFHGLTTAHALTACPGNHIHKLHKRSSSNANEEHGMPIQWGGLIVASLVLENLT